MQQIASNTPFALQTLIVTNSKACRHLFSHTDCVPLSSSLCNQYCHFSPKDYTSTFCISHLAAVSGDALAVVFSLLPGEGKCLALSCEFNFDGKLCREVLL